MNGIRSGLILDVPETHNKMLNAVRYRSLGRSAAVRAKKMGLIYFL